MNEQENESVESINSDEPGDTADQIASSLTELESEFWNIQGKVDKLGDFGFKVKAWSIALTSAFLVGAVSQKFDSWFLPLALFGILAFFILDKYHDVWKNAFVIRCKAIERKMQKLKMQRSPDELREIRKWKQTRTPASLIDAIKLKTEDLTKPKWTPPWGTLDRKKLYPYRFCCVSWGKLLLNLDDWIRNPCGRLILHANGVFYVFQTLLIIAATLWLAIGTSEPQEENKAMKVDLEHPIQVEFADELEIKPDSFGVRVIEDLDEATKDYSVNGQPVGTSEKENVIQHDQPDVEESQENEQSQTHEQPHQPDIDKSDQPRQHAAKPSEKPKEEYQNDNLEK